MPKALRGVLIPLTVLLLLLLINVIKDVDFLDISNVNGALYGNIPNILFGATELVIITIGMTLVTSASGGQDISVGVVATITSAVFIQALAAFGPVSWLSVAGALVVSCAVGALLGLFNGTLVAIFRIQPMVATLILFTAGRSIAFLIDGKVSPNLKNAVTTQIGGVIPGVPIQTPIILTVVVIAVFAVLFKLTNLRLYTQTVGINEKAARLNGIDPVKVKLLVFVILGICCAVAGFISVCKNERHDSVNLLKLIEMDAILAVALGGNALIGGKFNLPGAIIGAYTIEVLNRTLLRFGISPDAIKAVKAAFIIFLMIVSSPVVMSLLDKARGKIAGRLEKSASDKYGGPKTEGA
ncbi:MAG: ABC transporter permease [Clostridiales Family XIII bacterium]|jgi:simple sugar transport system permease protein|nr:ABC transporter permease [Clostridiales Family XIII bacterium]